MKEITMSEFIEDLWNNAQDKPEEIDISTARADLENFRRDGWTLPEGITPESYMEAWNELVKKAGESDDN